MNDTAKIRKFALFSRIPIRAVLNTSLSKLKNKLSYYPALEIISDGSCPRYAAKREANDEKWHVFEFSKKHIAIETYSKISPFYSMDESLLKLLSISSFLSQEYSFDIASLFPYIIAALINGRGKVQKITATNRTGVAACSGADLILAKRINELHGEVEQLRAENGKMESVVDKLTFEIMLSEGISKECSIKALEGKYGINRKCIDEAIGLLKSNGYGLVYSSKDTFMVVKI